LYAPFAGQGSQGDPRRRFAAIAHALAHFHYRVDMFHALPECGMASLTDPRGFSRELSGMARSLLWWQ